MKPRIVELLSIPLPDYGILLSLSLLAGILWTNRAMKQRGFPETYRSSILLLSVASVLIGAKLFYLLQFPGSFKSAPLALLRNGFSLYGGLLGLTAAVLWSSLRFGHSSLAVLDAMAPALALGLVFTRIGCFLAGCCFGKPTELPWGVRFPIGSGAWLQQVRDGIVPADAALTLPIHPTQLYEAAFGLALLALAVTLPPRTTVAGRLFFSLVGLYAIFRLWEENLRADAGGVRWGALTFSQAVSLVVLTGAAIGILRRSKAHTDGA